MKIRPVGGKFHANTHDESFHNFANVPKIYKLLPRKRVAFKNLRFPELLKNSSMAHYVVHKRPPLVPKRSQTNSFHTLVQYFHTQSS